MGELPAENDGDRHEVGLVDELGDALLVEDGDRAAQPKVDAEEDEGDPVDRHAVPVHEDRGEISAHEAQQYRRGERHVRVQTFHAAILVQQHDAERERTDHAHDNQPVREPLQQPLAPPVPRVRARVEPRVLVHGVLPLLRARLRLDVHRRHRREEHGGEHRTRHGVERAQGVDELQHLKIGGDAGPWPGSAESAERKGVSLKAPVWSVGRSTSQAAGTEGIAVGDARRVVVAGVPRDSELISPWL
mmetsp:Transcript_23169/g.46248  ORF Transcript_23169/g.46248 Transcript_23169/m.46248 type:complete len:246 (-) Transcript_23169:312-1049(-)